MTALEELVTKIDQTAIIANRNLEDLPVNVRPSWGTRIIEAKSNLKDLNERYKRAVLGSAVAIFVSGDEAKSAEFAALVSDSKEGVVVDASALYKRLADAIEPTLSDDRRFGVTQTYKLHQGLQEVMHEVGLSEMDMPDRALEVVVPDYAAIVEHARNIIRNAVGDMLNRLYLEKLTADAALAIRYIGGMTPVILLNALPTERNGLSAVFAKGAAEVEVTEADTINQEFMENKFKDVNKKIRKQKK